ncbi:EamA family transporter, partial [Streptomyces sp. NPDC057757]
MTSPASPPPAATPGSTPPGPTDAAPAAAPATEPASAAATAAAPARLSGAVWAALAVVYVVWGSTYLGIRIVVETMPSFFSASARFLTAGLLLVGFELVRQRPEDLRVSGRLRASA